MFGETFQRLTRADVRRGVAAGTAWGFALTAGLTALAAWECGGICLTDIAYTAMLAVGGGILTIGPLAASRLRRSAVARC
jgi:hypothetical protein